MTEKEFLFYVNFVVERGRKEHTHREFIHSFAHSSGK